MDLGIPTMVEMKSIEEAAAFASSLGFSFVELNMNLPWCTLENLQKTDFGSLTSRHNIYFTIHADENLFFCDFSERVAKAHTQNMLDAIDLARNNGMPLINFHMSRGVYFTLPEERVYLFDQYRDVYIDKLLRFREECAASAKNDVMLCIENTGIREDFVWQGIDLLLDSPAFALTWDLGHDYSAGLCDTPRLMPLKEHILHIHLHDAEGKDCHLPLGNGKMDIGSMLSCVLPKRMVLEVKTLNGIRQSVPWLKAHHYM